MRLTASIIRIFIVNSKNSNRLTADGQSGRGSKIVRLPAFGQVFVQIGFTIIYVVRQSEVKDKEGTCLEFR